MIHIRSVKTGSYLFTIILVSIYVMFTLYLATFTIFRIKTNSSY